MQQNWYTSFQYDEVWHGRRVLTFGCYKYTLYTLYTLHSSDVRQLFDSMLCFLIDANPKMFHIYIKLKFERKKWDLTHNSPHIGKWGPITWAAGTHSQRCFVLTVCCSCSLSKLQQSWKREEKPWMQKTLHCCFMFSKFLLFSVLQQIPPAKGGFSKNYLFSLENCTFSLSC